MLEQYKKEAEEREKLGIAPLPLSVEQVEVVISLLEHDHEEKELLMHMLEERVEPGVSETAGRKAFWLEKVVNGDVQSPVFTAEHAIQMLSKMSGGYCVEVLVNILKGGIYQAEVAAALKLMTKVYDAFDEIKGLSGENNYAAEVLESWGQAEWFTSAPRLPERIELLIYRVEGEINTDDFSAGNQAHTRTDIPLHANFFGNKRFPDGVDFIREGREQGATVGFAGDVVGTGSSRKSAVNSVLWHIGEDIPGVPNKRRGGFLLGSTIAPIFYGSARDAGLLPIQGDVTNLATGTRVIFKPYDWLMELEDGTSVELKPPPPSLLDEYRAGGRLNLIIGKKLTQSACEVLDIDMPDIFSEEVDPVHKDNQEYTLAQKIIGRACGVVGILPGTSCLPKIATVGSQDTTGPMTVQEIEELACRKFKTDFFLQTYCHTAAYPKSQDLARWELLRKSILNCGGLVINPGDGVIHSWINKMLVPDEVGTGGDSHTRFPLGISFPAGSSLVAFAAALGFMPLEMPESVLVRFHGKRKKGITVRDMVNAIPYFAVKEGFLSIHGEEKINVFSGTVLEIEGVDDLTLEEAFELTDASAERSAAACTIQLPLETVIAKVQENVAILETLVEKGYQAKEALETRINAMKKWLDDPKLLTRDKNAEYKAVIEIDLAKIDQPILACPNDPDDVKLLGDCAGTPIDEVFIGSCMTHLAHLRSASDLLTDQGYAVSRLWVAPTTSIDQEKIRAEGRYSLFAQAGARMEIPGCSLCMGNQARVKPGGTVFSTSTRNFDNRMGDNTRVYLGSTEVGAMSALLGALPSVEEYFDRLAK